MVEGGGAFLLPGSCLCSPALVCTYWYLIHAHLTSWPLFVLSQPLFVLPWPSFVLFNLHLCLTLVPTPVCWSRASGPPSGTRGPTGSLPSHTVPFGVCLPLLVGCSLILTTPHSDGSTIGPTQLLASFWSQLALFCVFFCSNLHQLHINLVLCNSVLCKLSQHSVSELCPPSPSFANIKCTLPIWVTMDTTITTSKDAVKKWCQPDSKPDASGK